MAGGVDLQMKFGRLQRRRLFICHHFCNCAQRVGRSKMDKMYTDFMAFMRKSGKLGEDLDGEMEKEARC